MPGSRIDLRHVRYVIAAAEHGSFRRAGQALGVEQSAISRRIRDLEDMVGGALFRRHAVGVELTDAGRRFLDEARRAIDLIGHAVDGASAAAVSTSQLRVGLSLPLTSGFLSDLFAAFRRERPSIRLQFVEAGTAQVIADVGRGTLDIGFVVDGSPAPGIAYSSLWHEIVSVVMPVDDPLCSGETVTWEDLRDRRLLLTEPNGGADLTADHLGQLNSDTSGPVIERHAVTRESLLQIVAFGGGFTIACGLLDGADLAGIAVRPIDGATLAVGVVHATPVIDPALCRLLALATAMSVQRLERKRRLPLNRAEEPRLLQSHRRGGALARSRGPTR